MLLCLCVCGFMYVYVFMFVCILPDFPVNPDDQFAIPVKSMTVPLRSCFLDPETNTFPRSKTRSELMRKLKNVRQPHLSYDLDNDGYVSQDDYKIAKRFDSNGIICY